MLQAIGKYVLIQVPEQRESKGGIALPEKYIQKQKREQKTGVVVSKGSEVEATINEGDIIFYNPARIGPIIEHNEQEFTVILSVDIIAVEKNNKKK